MSVVEVKRNDRLASIGRSVSGFTYEGDAIEVYTVEFTVDHDPRKMPYDAINHDQIPQKDTSHPANTFLYVVDHKTRWIGACMQEVTVIYKYIEDPLLQPATINYSFATTSEFVDVDGSGNAIVNSAGETFDPPTTKEVSDVVFRIQRYSQDWTAGKALTYLHHVNEDVVWGIPQGHLLLRDWTADYVKIAKEYYFFETMEFYIRYSWVPPSGDSTAWTLLGWQTRRLDEGFRVKSGTDSEGKPTYQTITDEYGKVLASPTLLDGSGGKLSDSAKPKYLNFDVYPKIAFAPLNLPYNTG